MEQQIFIEHYLYGVHHLTENMMVALLANKLSSFDENQKEHITI
jgi:hypothetical protein